MWQAAFPEGAIMAAFIFLIFVLCFWAELNKEKTETVAGVVAGLERLFSVKYLFGEVDVAWNFLLL